VVINIVLHDSNDTVREIAAEILAWIGQDAKASAPSVIKILRNQDGDPIQRSRAARVLGCIGNNYSNSMNTLVQVLKNSKEPQIVRLEAAKALKAFGRLRLSTFPRLSTLL